MKETQIYHIIQSQYYKLQPAVPYKQYLYSFEKYKQNKLTNLQFNTYQISKFKKLVRKCSFICQDKIQYSTQVRGKCLIYVTGYILYNIEVYLQLTGNYFYYKMHPSSSETVIFKNQPLRNTSIRATLKNKNQIQAINNLSFALPVSVAKKKSISTVNIKNLQSFSTSALPCYKSNQSNNCESTALSSNRNKNKNVADAERHAQDELQQSPNLKPKNMQPIIQEHKLFKSKLKKKNSDDHNQSNNNIKSNAYIRETISFNLQNIQNLRQTTCPNTTPFIPKHKQPQWIQKMQSYCKSTKNKNLNLDKINQTQPQQVRTPKFLHSNDSPEKNNDNKFFFRQTLDPKLQRNLFQTKFNIVTPTNPKKKPVEKDISLNKIQKTFKNQSKNATLNLVTNQQGVFWKNKAVSPPSKPWQPQKTQPQSQKDIKVPILPFNFDQKPHKPSFFMHKKSLSRFNIMKQLGSGTYSDSFLCIDKKSNAIFCLKRFHKATIKNFPQVLDGFIKKVAFQFLADHPNIVQLYDIFCDVEFVYIVEQYMQGGKLSDLLQKQLLEREQKRRKTQTFNIQSVKQSEEPLFHESKIIDKIFDINSSLCYIHQTSDKIIKYNKKKLPPLSHGDVRTKSILISMGVCKLPTIQPAQMKPCFIDSCSPPEQIIQQIYVPKSDIWNLGLVLFELCAERKLFGHAQCQGQNMLEQDCKPGYQVFNVNITQQVEKLTNTTQVLKELMKKLLTIQPEDRPSSNVVMASNVFQMYGFDVQWKQRRQQMLTKQKSYRDIQKFRETNNNKSNHDHFRQQHEMNQNANVENHNIYPTFPKAELKKENLNASLNLKYVSIGSKDSNSNMSNTHDSTQITQHQAQTSTGVRPFWNKIHEPNKKS